jgi:predicted transcriptional regulator
MARMGLGELENDVMRQLWASDAPLTVREVHERLAENRTLAYTTVMTVLDRLARKGVVRQERSGRAYLYSAASSREEMAAELMFDALGEVGDPGARLAALQYFVGKVGKREAEAIQEALRTSADRAL